MKCYDYECIAIVKLEGYIWADDEKSAQRAIKANDIDGEITSCKIRHGQTFNLKLEEVTE